MILILGDIHGRIIWKDIIEREKPDLTIFLGDYIDTHESISIDQQIENLNNILTYKQDNPDKTVLLRGNHDLSELGYYWAECSGYNPTLSLFMQSISCKFLNLTQWIYIIEDIKTVFSHAGISQVWMDNSKIGSIYEINNLAPSEIFGFTPNSPFDCYGDSITQPPTWIRPQTLCRCNIKEWDQVVGHTPVYSIVNMYKSTKSHKNIWLCDSIGQGNYLVIDNDKFIPKSFT